MESIVTGMVLAAAKRMGIDPESVIVKNAVETAVLAVRDGRELDLSAELGCSVLVQAMQPAA
jgi:CO/xanthine dehydrogenase Mo-binding subunit